MDRFKMADPSPMPKLDPGYWALLDRYGKPILYYPATGKPNIHKPLDSNKPSFVGDYASGGSQDAALYNARDNYNSTSNTGAMPLKTLQVMMGDGRNADPSKGITAVPPNGYIDGNEQPAFEGPFLLWSSGPDEVFGSTTASLDKTDDITNFRK